MNPAQVVAILGQLVSVAGELNAMLHDIREHDPDTWAKISAAYPDALAKLKAAQPK